MQTSKHFADIICAAPFGQNMGTWHYNQQKKKKSLTGHPPLSHVGFAPEVLLSETCRRLEVVLGALRVALPYVAFGE